MKVNRKTDNAGGNWNGRYTRPQSTRPTIGLLIENTAGVGEYQSTLWAGITDAAQEKDVNLICFTGGTLGFSPYNEFENQRNVAYDLVTTENVDGLVISGGSLSSFATPEEIRSLYDRYLPLPMVSIAVSFAGIPSILVDNDKGMRDVIVHLIETHGYHHIALIRGPEGNAEAEQRYRVYTDVLVEYGLPLDPDLVAPGDFSPASGAAAIRLLLEQQKVDFEAVVAANDNMALGALEALQARGIRVPGDVAVVGFDDIEETTAVTPPLTTVRQPIYGQGKQAAEMLLALLAGEEVPEQVTLPTRLVVRRSCGCESSAVVQAAAGLRAAVGPVKASRKKFEAVLTTQREEILAGMTRAGGELGGSLDPAWAGQLLDGFAAELGGESAGAFLAALDEVLRQVAAAAGDVAVLHGALSALRRYTLPYLDDEALSLAEDLWQQARVMIGETAQRAQVYRTLQAEQQTHTLREIGQTLITTFEVNELMNVVAQELPRLSIPSCYLSLYEQHPELVEGGHEMLAQRSRLILAYDENGRVELETSGRRFLSHQLVPDGMLPRERHYSIVVEPLYFREEQLGFALLEMGPREGAVYETLRGQLSSALKGALLLRERERTEKALEKAYAEVEKRIEEQTAELQREIAKRERAQGESARLQQEVIEAQKRTLQELSTPIIPIMERIIVMPLIGSIDTLRARDITRALLAGIREHRAKVVILDITGVPVVDSGVASHLNKTIQAARLKGARTIVTGVSDAVAEIIVDLGIDWSGIETLADLRTGLLVALSSLGIKLTR